MKPVDFSRENFAEIRDRLDAKRAAAHLAWLEHGPGTTREVAQCAGWDLLAFRPRSTELYQLGLLELMGRDGHQGIYRPRSLEEWETHCAWLRGGTYNQLSLKMPETNT